MDAVLESQIENEIFQLDILIKAAEDWGRDYKKDRKTYRALIVSEAKFQRDCAKFFRKLAKKVPENINWSEYNRLLDEHNKVETSRVDAAKKVNINIKTIISGDLFEDEDDLFIEVAKPHISTSTYLGAKAAERIYKVPLNIKTTTEFIKDLTTERLAQLVGKKVDKDGNLVDNPRADYRISDKTRDQIATSIKTSIEKGEDKAKATERLIDIVGNPQRAQDIAQTETINAYGNGKLGFGKASGATGKEWEDLSATDECAEYANEGIVPLDHDYDGAGLQAPAAHNRCRCSQRLVYANEYNPDE